MNMLQNPNAIMQHPLMKQLHEIEGLDHISKWPLALGWWVIIVIAIHILLFILWKVWKKILFNRSWRKDTLLKLRKLEEQLTEETKKETLVLLSEFLRRIAVHRYSRKECAGLVGAHWLKWLEDKDPKKFCWETKGDLLVKAPYAPHENMRCSIGIIKELIQAARGWVI